MRRVRTAINALLHSNGALISALVGALPGLWFSQVVWGGLGWLSAPYWSGMGFPDGGDIHAGLGAELHFVAAPWALPIFDLPTLLANGAPISLLATDAIPLTALIAKLLMMVGLSLNVFGLWFIIVPVLQGAAAGLLAWALGAGGRLRPLAAALLALSYGHWIQKSAYHPNLSGHFTLLLALAVAAAITTGRLAPRRGVLLALALVPLALFQTPYLAAMTIAIAVGSIISALRAGLPRRSAAMALAGMVLFLALVLPLAGWTSFITDWGDASAYGSLGANLFSLIWPYSAGVAPGLQLDLPRLSVPPGQDRDSEVFVGGVALLFILFGLLRFGPRGLYYSLRRFAPLVGAVFACWLFSLTNNLGIGPIQIHLFDLPEPLAPLVHSFRWSARFAWPAAYLLMIVALVAASTPIRRLGGRIGSGLPGALVLLMASAGLVQSMNHGEIQAIHRLTGQYPLVYAERPFADRSLAGATALTLYPAHTCFGDIGFGGVNDYDADRLMRDQHTYWMTATGKLGISSTTAKLNRGGDGDCPGAGNYGTLISDALEDQTTVLALNGSLARELTGRSARPYGYCVAVPGVTVCGLRPQLDDPWVLEAGLPISRGGLPLVGGSISASSERMSTLLAWADGLSRRTDDQTLYEYWRPQEDPRLAEARIPVIGEVGSISLSFARGRQIAPSYLSFRSIGVTEIVVSGEMRLLADGEIIEIDALTPSCNEYECRDSFTLEVRDGALELLGVEIR